MNLVRSYSGGRPVGHDPWRGSTLEWFALSPPPAHNFDAVPDVRSAEPLRDIREAIREREANFVPPSPSSAARGRRPYPATKPGCRRGRRARRPTADPEDIVSDEAA